MGNELIGRGAQCGVSRETSVLRPVDVRLGMFDAYAHRKRFPFKFKAPLLEELEYVACRVSTGKDELVAGDTFLLGNAVRLRLDADGAHAAGASAGSLDVDKTCAETNLAPELANAGDDVLDNGGKNIGTHMGLGVPEDIARRAGRNDVFRGYADAPGSSSRW